MAIFKKVEMIMKFSWLPLKDTFLNHEMEFEVDQKTLEYVYSTFIENNTSSNF